MARILNVAWDVARWHVLGNFPDKVFRCRRFVPFSLQLTYGLPQGLLSGDEPSLELTNGFPHRLLPIHEPRRVADRSASNTTGTSHAVAIHVGRPMNLLRTPRPFAVREHSRRI